MATTKKRAAKRPKLAPAPVRCPNCDAEDSLYSHELVWASWRLTAFSEDGFHSYADDCDFGGSDEQYVACDSCGAHIP